MIRHSSTQLECKREKGGRDGTAPKHSHTHESRKKVSPMGFWMHWMVLDLGLTNGIISDSKRGANENLFDGNEGDTYSDRETS
ncbi:hypothetical protein RB195_007705 [Necator americanus]|uniref:Uncharacterized protein n=1 Tax=Necator americanus TaxID=51031 RepID=A0ABR1C0X0_NECAM